MLFRVISAAVVVCALGSIVSADIVYSQLPDGLDSWYSDLIANQLVADDFVLGVGAKGPGLMAVTDVHWWGGYGNYQLGTPIVPQVDDFTIDFFIDADGPDDIPFASFNVGNVARTFLGLQYDFYPSYYYSCDLPSTLIFSTGQTYYIGIRNHTGEVLESMWSWDTSSDGDGLIWFRDGFQSGWWDTSDFGQIDLAFQLTNSEIGPDPSVPEPFTCLLFGGSVLFGLARMRRKAA